jgi:hypothetical protein
MIPIDPFQPSSMPMIVAVATSESDLLAGLESQGTVAQGTGES